MTRKDYVLLAEVLGQTRAKLAAATGSRKAPGLALFSSMLAERLKAENPRFSQTMFAEAIAAEEAKSGMLLAYAPLSEGNHPAPDPEDVAT